MHAVSKNYPEKGELEWLAFDAGNDILCFAENTMEGIEKILKNASEEQIEESFQRVYKLKEKVFTQADNEALTDASPLNTAIAKKSITLYQGKASDIEQFRKEGFQIVCNSPEKAASFLNGLSFNNCSNVIEFKASKGTNHLLALFPPQIKPNNNFGFTLEELEKINVLLASENTVLYLFGNPPYVLNHLQVEKAKAVVIAYQDFKEFQEVAQQHFLGEHQAVGKLPVTIEK